MLPRATSFFIAGGRRSFSGDALAAVQMFIDAWKKVVPNIDPPKTPLSFMQPRPPAPDMVIVPATTGQMGILPGHVATMTELKPGVVSVHGGTETTKYFISGGFALIHANSMADIIALEAVAIERIDPSLVQKGLSEYAQKLRSATTDYERAEAQIGVDIHSALQSALTA